ncbi:MAG: nitrogenase component 1 [Firmicutes bacterium]|nr:nitrogenase component 1 [Bacillota bacterium]
MDGNKLLAQMKKLRDVETIKDVKSLTAAMFPGTHCPLMGAAMAVRGIKDSLMVIIGTDECSYYTKHMTIHSDEYGGLNGRVVSVTLDSHDVTFGCVKKVEAAFKEVVDEYHPGAVFLVTTCVVEIIGDDFDAVADALTEEYGIPVMAVHTEHFKCENHMPGIERTITACLPLMKKKPCDGSVNLLGQRLGNFEQTELSRILRDAGVKIGMQLPCGCTVDEIKNAAAAKVNIVVNEIALPLARKMKAKFGVPYVFFDKFVDPDRIAECYRMLFDVLELPLPEEIGSLCEQAKASVQASKAKLDGVSFIYGNTPFRCFEYSRFMAELGMIPQIIQTSAIKDEDRDDIAAILAVSDPYVTKTANIAPLQYIYDVLHPMLYLGHEYANRLRAKGIAMVRSDGASSMLGFECTMFAIRSLTMAADEAREIRKGGEFA